MGKPRKTDTVGTYIRQHVVPAGVSVKDAARALGVGRPALSNLLNGNSSLSPEMALRLEKAFGADSQKLLDLQIQAERESLREEEKAVAVRPYVPSFLTIKARQLEEWAENNIDARPHLAVLLRKLVHSSRVELNCVDFPGYDNAERKGWDGWLEASAATPWLPQGYSGWEFGTTQNVSGKAESDYSARLSAVPRSERANCTFVFVTPRNWAGKTEWVKKKNGARQWKAVKALDASDLEQWLEESIPAQMWLAEKIALPVKGFETLERCWRRWSTASEPQLTPQIFSASIAASLRPFKEWLGKQSERPFIVAADSRDEALAYLACLFQDSEIAPRWKDLAAVFESAEALRALSSSSSPFIPIVSTEDAERELVTLYRKVHCIVVRPRNAVDSEPDVALDLLSHEGFEKALGTMGIGRDDAERLDRESGRSPTILRRRLSKIDAIRTPQWVRDVEAARSLIPMTFVGAWHAESKADCEVVSILADRGYQHVEEAFALLLQFDDCPVWSVGQYRGVASKIDSLFAISKLVTRKDIEEFLMLAEYVVSESDPALDLPEEKRWAAGVYGKVRDHSAALREGICETLVILSVHGNNLFRDRLGIDVESRVSSLIQRLLMPLTLDKLLSQDRDLPSYAEAAPEEFLRLLEADLQQAEPVVLGLLKPAGSGIFGTCPRTGLLWALEGLAWRPQNLGRVSAVFAQLSRTKIEDNWANRPIESLQAIYRSWVPQTAAPLADRANSLEVLTKRFPDIGWQICIAQFELGSRIGHYSYRPRWRSEASGAGQVVASREHYEFIRKALDLALGWPKHDAQTLGDLVRSLEGMSAEDQIAVWDLVDRWSDTVTDDRAKADLREKIRRFALTRRGRRRSQRQATRQRAASAYAKLKPNDPVICHSWLFANQWVELSADEIEEKESDLATRDERIHRFRVEALQEIWAARGFEGVMTLLTDSSTPYTVGQYVASSVKDMTASVNLLQRCLSIEADLEKKVDNLMQGFLASVGAETRCAMLLVVARDSDVEQRVRLFRCAPFMQETWRLLDQYDLRDRYWREVYPYWNRHSDAELTEVIDRLLDAGRPRAAFHVVHMDWAKIETSRLKRLLLAVATSTAEPADTLQLSSSDISKALESLDARAGIGEGEMAQLEFLYISALAHSEHGIPNLERQVAGSPALFVQAMAMIYRRDDDGEDPADWRVDDPNRRAAMAVAAHRLLDRIKRIPGTDPEGRIGADGLARWLTEVRQQCAQYGRAKIGDHCIGQLLSRAPVGENGVWPTRSVCEAMERIASHDIADGFVIGVHNARGAQWRREGGGQERELAAKYRAWARQLAFEYPYVGGVVERVAASYEREGEWHDSEAQVKKRLRH